jgi:hypothetical protein
MPGALEHPVAFGSGRQIYLEVVTQAARQKRQNLSKGYGQCEGWRSCR